MSTKKRGRPKKNRLRDALPRFERGERVESMWRKKHEEAARGGNRGGADGRATEATARELRITPRRVQQIRKRHRQDVELFRRIQHQSAVRAREHSEYWDPKIEAARKLLTPAAWEQLQDLDAGWEIVDRLAAGAAAEAQNRKLRAEIEQVKNREKVRKDFAEASNPAKRK